MPIKYNYTKIQDKLLQVIRLQQLLIDEHHERADKYKQGNITLTEFRNYQEKEFLLKLEIVNSEFNKLKIEIRKDLSVNTTLDDVKWF